MRVPACLVALLIALLPVDAVAQRTGYGLEMTGIFGPDAFLTSGLNVFGSFRAPGKRSALLAFSSAEVGRKDFESLFDAKRVMLSWRVGAGYVLNYRNERDVFGVGPYLAYCQHHHRDTNDPDHELRWVRPYMQLGAVLSWTRLVGDGRLGIELRGTPALMGPVGDTERVRSDVPAAATWVFPFTLCLSLRIDKAGEKSNTRGRDTSTALPRNIVPSL
ncbi:MAG: hypothetical protein KF905_09325 [Flavobacteriales bacterium]|nr:hypothetical protein [Flavobacteriales bacterium]